MAVTANSPRDIGSLSQANLSVLFFRASCALGTAIEEHRELLFRAMDRRRFRSPLSFLQRLSEEWLDRRADDFVELDYDGHLDLIRKHVSAMAEASSKLGTVCQQISASLRSVSPEELSLQFDALSLELHAVVGRSIAQFGGNLSRDRWNSCQVADVRYMDPEVGPTRCTFQKARRDEIRVHIGGLPQKAGLRTFFNLRFYFFHEYISHSFSACQDALFSDGYLIWAEKKLLSAVAPDRLRIELARETFWPYAQPECSLWTHDICDWFESIIGSRFLKFLLDWAAQYTPETGKSGTLLLDALGRISDQVLPGQVETGRIVRIFERATPGQIRDGILDFAREISGLPAPSREMDYGVFEKIGGDVILEK